MHHGYDANAHKAVILRYVQGQLKVMGKGETNSQQLRLF